MATRPTKTTPVDTGTDAAVDATTGNETGTDTGATVTTTDTGATAGAADSGAAPAPGAAVAERDPSEPIGTPPGGGSWTWDIPGQQWAQLP